MGCCWFCCKRNTQIQSVKFKDSEPLESQAPVRYPVIPQRVPSPPPEGKQDQEPQKVDPTYYTTFESAKALEADKNDESPYCNKDIWLNPYNTEEFVTYMHHQLRGRNAGLVKEFNSLGSLKFRFASDDAKSMNNRKKNFDASFIPYDMSRVKLKNESTYINASVIPGFYRESKYVVAQIPFVSSQVSTLGDFWEMVWQENIRCMLSLTPDMGQGDPEKGAYWPKDKVTEQTFGDSICVKLTQRSIYELTTHRTFIVSLEENRKKSFLLHQVEFNSKLLDQKTPGIFPLLLSLVKQIRDITGNMGESGKVCFVSKWSNSLIGILLAVFEISKALEDRSPFSVFATMDFLLDHRTSLVIEYYHYKLIYIMVLELIQDLKPVSLEELQHLQVGKIDPETEETSAVTIEYNKVNFFCNKAYFMKSQTVANLHSKGETTNSYPYDDNRVSLTNSPTNSDYINASYVHMESGSAPIIAAVHPTKGSIREFLWMLMSCEAELVFVLGKGEEIHLMNEAIIKPLSYWAPLNQDRTYGEFSLHRSRPQEAIGMQMFEIIVSYKPPKVEKRQHRFKLYLYKDWDKNDLPTDNKGCMEVLKFIEEFRMGPAGDKPVVIQSIDGSTKIGVMLATLNGSCQVQKGEELDMPWIVKNLRNQRMKLISCKVSDV